MKWIMLPLALIALAGSFYFGGLLLLWISSQYGVFGTIWSVSTVLLAMFQILTDIKKIRNK